MGSVDHGSGSPSAAGAPIPGGGSPPPVVDKGVDVANYFCTYGFLYHQKEMLSDRVRMDAYYNAVFDNAADHFRGKGRAEPSKVFLLYPPLRVNIGDNIEVSFTMSRSKQYHRLMDVEFCTTLHKLSGKSLRPVTSKFHIE